MTDKEALDMLLANTSEGDLWFATGLPESECREILNRTYPGTDGEILQKILACPGVDMELLQVMTGLSEWDVRAILVSVRPVSEDCEVWLD